MGVIFLHWIIETQINYCNTHIDSCLCFGKIDAMIGVFMI